jgi:general L-amino acid transport system permease protein
VETVRNIPLLLQLFIWYALVLKPLPDPAKSYAFFGSFFFSNKGVFFPDPTFGDGAWLAGVLFAAAIVATLVLRSWARARQARTGQQFPYVLTGIAMIVLAPVLGLLLAGWPLTFDYPALGTGMIKNFKGGLTLYPEFVALLLGLSIYTASFIAEIVRAGIQAVSHGQSEASNALGLRHGPALRLVVIPQALRVIIPPLSNQYLNLTKNSSLAVAIGYPDLMAMGGTVNNQSGRIVEVMLIWMVVYLSLSLLTAGLMNWYNASKRLVER